MLCLGCCLCGIFLARRDAKLGLPLGEYFNSTLLRGFEFIWDRLGGSGPYVLCKTIGHMWPYVATLTK
jgi:hypothetical protein